MTTTTRPAHSAQPPEGEAAMVVLAGGPLDSRWYWAEDFDQARRGCGVNADALLAYHRTTRVLPNPIARYGPGQVWVYSPPAHPHQT